MSDIALTHEEIREVFRKIAAGERVHGSFLVAFATAYIRSDKENEAILRPAAVKLIRKYQLEEYADNDTKIVE